MKDKIIVECVDALYNVALEDMYTEFNRGCQEGVKATYTAFSKVITDQVFPEIERLETFDAIGVYLDFLYEKAIELIRAM